MMYYRVVLALGAGAAVRALVGEVLPGDVLHVDVHGVAAYLGVMGGLYGIVVAFLIFVVWDQFNRVQMGLAREASALEDLCRVAGFLSERGAANRVRLAVKQYLKSTAGDEPARLARGESSAVAQEHFAALCQAVRGAEVATEKDAVVYDELLRALARAMEARDERLGVSATRIPRTLWNLVVFVSLVVFGGFLVLGLRSPFLAVAVPAAAAGSITFLLSVIRDMDNPFSGVWNVSYAVMSGVAARLG